MKLLMGVVLVLAVAMAGVGQAKRGETGGRSGDPEHGKYIVQDVAQCTQCHSPRDGNGTLLADRLLTGAPVPVGSPYPNQRWSYQAPPIAGLPGYTEEEGIRLLTQGIARNGQRPLSPMPQFRMTEQDARDVVAYLRSLP